MNIKRRIEALEWDLEIVIDQFLYTYMFSIYIIARKYISLPFYMYHRTFILAKCNGYSLRSKLVVRLLLLLLE